MLHAGKWRSGNPHVRFNHRPGTVIVTGRRPGGLPGLESALESTYPPDALLRKSCHPIRPQGLPEKRKERPASPFMIEDGNSLRRLNQGYPAAPLRSDLDTIAFAHWVANRKGLAGEVAGLIKAAKNPESWGKGL